MNATSINIGNVLVINNTYIIKAEDIDNRSNNIFIHGKAFLLEDGIPTKEHEFGYLNATKESITHATIEQSMRYEARVYNCVQHSIGYEPDYQQQYYGVTFNGTEFRPEAFIRTTVHHKPHYMQAFKTIELCEACCIQLNKTLSQAPKN